jgi:hypothetical protein
VKNKGIGANPFRNLILLLWTVRRQSQNHTVASVAPTSILICYIIPSMFSEDELASDSYPMKLADDLIFEFKGRHVVRKEGDVALDGANPSTEEQDEGTEEHVERGIDFVLNHRLQEMNCYEVNLRE